MINFGNVVTVGIGGFIVPFVLMVVLVVISVLKGGGTNLIRLVASIVSVTAVTTAVLLWMPLEMTWASIMARFVIGILAGAISYVVCADRVSSVTGALGGIVWGNLVASLISYFLGGADAIVLGSAVVFDSIVLAMVFAVVLAMVTKQMRIGSGMHAGAGAEFAEDNEPDKWDKYDHHLD